MAVATYFNGHRCDLRCEWCGRRITMSYWSPVCCAVCDASVDAVEEEWVRRHMPEGMQEELSREAE